VADFNLFQGWIYWGGGGVRTPPRAGGAHDRHNSAPELAEHTPPPPPLLPDHAGSIPDLLQVVQTPNTATREIYIVAMFERNMASVDLLSSLTHQHPQKLEYHCERFRRTHELDSKIANLNII
jgi:hypothetical protein